ncbi:LuxR C-terminal-related transcriptional regulator [Puerhibacterium puerhi]|uniref:LuxR C-terminal-related transcriptional regulator n=1 Tax=Puerhibacterium puerhi TaxID=2692623 RepID=UPI001357CD3D|nr:LuxR C-terminal-related transcriptional regulator [Puerhibacterium puerhi]
MSGATSRRGVQGAPRVPRNGIERPRLLARLDPTTPLTVVRAPAGSGKSLLVAQWCRTLDVAGVWVGLDGESGTRESAWQAVAARLVDAGLVAPDSLLARAGELLGGVADVRGLLVRAFAQLTDPVLVVIDDYHTVDDAALHDDVLAVVAACPAVSVVVTTRTASPLEAAQVALTVDRTLLAFTLDETRALLAAHGVDESWAEEVHRACGGNPLLVRAVLLQGVEAGTAADPASPGSLARDVVLSLLARAEPAVRHLVLRTSLPEAFDLELAGLLAGGSTDAEDRLDDLEALGLVMRSEGPGGPVYRYHPLVRDVLQREASVRLGRDLARLHVLVARWSLHHGEPLTALRHAVRGGDLRLASDVLIGSWYRLITSTEMYRAVAQVPRHQVARYPTLAMARAIAANANPDRRLRALEYLATAVAAARLVGPRTAGAERATIATVEAVALRLSGLTDQGVGAARRALSVLATATAEELEPLGDQAGQLRVQDAITLARAGHLTEARQALMVNLADRPRLPLLTEMSTLAVLGSITALLGELPSARRLVAEVAGGPWPDELRDGYSGAPYHAAAVLAALERFDCGGAQQHIDTLGPHLPALEYRPLFVALQAMVHGLGGRAELGLQELERYRAEDRRHRRSSPIDTIVLQSVTALLELAQGRAGAAEQALRGLPTRQPLVAIVRATIALVGGEPETVVATLARGGVTRAASPRAAAAGHLLVAAGAQRLGDADAVTAALERMAALMADQELRIHLVLVPRPDLHDLRAHAQAHGLVLAAEQLAELDDVPDAMPARVSRIVLTARESVILHALLDGRSFTKIAEELVVSPNTVKTQVKSLYRKLGVTSREDAILAAYREGVLTPGDGSDGAGDPEASASSAG